MKFLSSCTRFLAPVAISVLGVLPGCSPSEITGGWGDDDDVDAGEETQRKSKTFTSEPDFASGVASGVNYSSQPGQLQMTTGRSTFETPYIWIANSSENTVTQIDTKTNNPLRTIALEKDGVKCTNPSRTAVAENYDVWVMCRGSANAVKISHESGEVLFIVPLEGIPRAVAIDAQGYIWIGCGQDGAEDDPLWKLDEATGACVLGRNAGCEGPPIPVADWPYGGAVDQRGYLWVLSNHHWTDGTLTKVDTTTNQVIGRYKRTDGGCAKFYGLAIDQLGDIWTGNAQCDDVLKFDGETGDFIGGYMSGGEVTRGVAVDLDGNVWVANSGTSTITKIHGHTGDILETLNTGNHPIGIGVDAYGHVWAVNRGANNVYKFNGITLDETPIPVGQGPYTYSDMLGTLLRTITLNNDGTGYWTVNYDTGANSPAWDQVSWNAEEPGSSKITARTRCAATEADLYTALWSDVISEPGPMPCEHKRWIQLEVKFQADNLNSAPILDDVTIIWES